MAKKENKNIHELEIKIEGKKWTDAIDKAFTEKQKTVKVDGFRAGKVPRSVFEKKFGKESLYLDATNYVLQDAYKKAMEDSKLEPVVQPSVDIKSIDDKGVVFTFKVITKPEVSVKKYKGLKIKPEKVTELYAKVGENYGDIILNPASFSNFITLLLEYRFN